MRGAGGLVADGQQHEQGDDDDSLLLGEALVAACVGGKKAVRTLSPLTCSPLHHIAGVLPMEMSRWARRGWQQLLAGDQ